MDELDLGATIKGFAPGQKVLNRYKLERILGRGGMGVVWLARDEELERNVALKFLPEVVALDKEAVADLKRETRRNLDLTHPHIVRIHDFVSDQRTAAIAMEYVDGATLAAMKLEQPARVFSVAELEPWVRQLFDALHYAHTKAKVVHRDLKPANLMVTREGDLKITDFGIATGITDSVSRVSKQAGSSGTPVYMSPQQMMGEKPAVTDDIYAVGATLYELLTGKPPFYSGNIIVQVQGKVPPPMAERRKELGGEGAPIPAAWEEAIAACLAKAPAGRPQSVGALAERLRLTAGGAAASTRPAPSRRTGGDPPATPGSKTPLYAGLAAAVLLLGASGYYFGVAAPENARQEAAKRAAAAQAEQTRLAAERVQRAEELRLANARGGIVLRTTPANTEVQIGGFALEHGPTVTLKDVKLGKYPVVARAPDHEEWRGEVTVEENKFANLDITLAHSTGSAELTSEPAGVAFVLQAAGNDGIRREGVTPARLDGLPTGQYTVEFSRKGLRRQTAAGTVARGAALKLSATLPAAKMDDEGYVIQQVLDNVDQTRDPAAKAALYSNLMYMYIMARPGEIDRRELQRMAGPWVQTMRQIRDPYERANSLRSALSYHMLLDAEQVRQIALDTVDAAKAIEDRDKRVQMTGWVIDAACPIPDLARSLLEDYRLLLGDDVKSYAAYTLPEKYARLGLESEGRAQLERFAESEKRWALKAFERGRTWRLYDQALTMAQKGDRAGAKAIIMGFPEEIDSTPCIYGIYAYSKMGDFELARIIAEHAQKTDRSTSALGWLASAATYYDRPDLGAEYARKIEDKAKREDVWREIALYYAAHGLSREARSAAGEIQGVGSSYTFAVVWSVLGEKEKARQAARLSPELAGTKEAKGSTYLSQYFVLLGDAAGLDKLETSTAAESIDNRNNFYTNAAEGYAQLLRREEALAMIQKIPEGSRRVYPALKLGSKIAAVTSVEEFTFWVEGLPAGEIRGGVLVGWLTELRAKRNLAKLGLPVKQN